MTDVRPTKSVNEGKYLLVVAWQSTALLVLVLLCGVIWVDRFGVLVVTISALMFCLGVLLLALALAIGLRRSRFEQVSVGNLFLLQGSPPPVVRKVLIGSVLAQLVAAFTAAGVRMYTEVAFAVLAPTFGLGLAAVWASRYGTFPSRSSDPV